MHRVLLAVATAAYLAIVGWITLGPAPYDDETGDTLARILAALAGFAPTAWITFDVVEFTANVALFVPLGILVVLWLGGRRWWLAPIAGLVISGAIELIQLLFLETRVADARDLLANTLGALLGGLGMLLVRRARRYGSARRGSSDPTPA